MSNAPTLDQVRRVVAYLEKRSIRTWIFGGWGEELRALSHATLHDDIDLLYLSDSFAQVDHLIQTEGLPEITAKHLPHKRAVLLEGVMVEVFLMGADDCGYYTLFWDRIRHDWPADVLGSVNGSRVASVAALSSYRQAHDNLHEHAANPLP